MDQPIDNIQLNFSEESLMVLNICLAFIMFGVALDLKPSDFKRLVKNPQGTVLGLISQFLVLPALTFLVILILNPMPSLALGMIMVAACPGGNVSNFICTLARGNVALSVTLTGLSSTFAVLLTPLNFTLWASMLPGSETLASDIHLNPTQVIFTIITLLAVPLMLGMFTNSAFPETTAKIKRPVRILSIIIFAAFVVIAFVNNFDFFVEYIHIIALLVLAHNAVALVGGYSMGRIFGQDQPTCRAISIETGIQNSGLALVIIFNFFEGMGGMALIAAWWGIWHLISGSILAYFWSRRAVAVSPA